MKITFRMALVCASALVVLVPRLQAQAVRTIYLVRHADKVSDDPDAPLSDAGRRRAECLAATLADAHIEKSMFPTCNERSKPPHRWQRSYS